MTFEHIFNKFLVRIGVLRKKGGKHEQNPSMQLVMLLSPRRKKLKPQSWYRWKAEIFFFVYKQVLFSFVFKNLVFLGENHSKNEFFRFSDTLSSLIITFGKKSIYHNKEELEQNCFSNTAEFRQKIQMGKIGIFENPPNMIFSKKS